MIGALVLAKKTIDKLIYVLNRLNNGYGVEVFRKIPKLGTFSSFSWDFQESFFSVLAL